MKVIVCVSLVPDSTTKVKIAQNGKSIDQSGVQYIINPYDEFAVEEAVQFKEKHSAESIAVSFGTEKSKEAIKKAFQMGIDNGVLIKADSEVFDSFTTAINLAEYLKSQNPDVILFGKQSIDYDGLALPSLVSELTGIPSVNVVIKMEMRNGNFVLEKEIEGGKEIIETTTPVIIGTQKGINNPRYPNLKSIMAAKKKQIEEIPASYTGNRTEVTGMNLPASKGTGKILTDGVNDVPELVRLMREEAKVI